MLMTIAVRSVETMFAAGAIGCVFVLVLTTIEDLRTLLGYDENPSS